MTSSSAYNNVLLKTPVQAQPASVPKRDYQNDSAASDFQQALQDVRDSSMRQSDLRDKNIRAQNLQADTRDANRRQDEKLAQANNDKAAASADSRKPTNDASQQQSADSVDQSDQKAGDNICAKDKATGSKTTDTKKTKKTEDTTEDAAAATATATVTSSDTALPTALTIAAASANTDENSLTTEKELAPTTIDSDSAKNKTAESADALLITQTTAGDSSSNTTQGLTDPALQQTAADAALQQAALVSASQAATQNPMTPVNAAATEAVPTDAVADGLASLSIDSLGTEKSSNKTATAEASSTADAESATTSTLAQEVDPKSSFEKMLQSVARTGISAKDESAIANTSNNANSSSSTNSNATDSLFRVSDIQTPAARSFVVQTAVPVPVGQPQWSQAVGERVLWLAAQNVSSAEINLHPKDLGPLQVKVSLNQEQATVSFTSHHAVVREVLDQNLNRLRDMFSEQGLNLVNVDVSDKSFSRQQGENKDQKAHGDTNNPVEDETPVAVSAIVQKRLVDHYA